MYNIYMRLYALKVDVCVKRLVQLCYVSLVVRMPFMKCRNFLKIKSSTSCACVLYVACQQL